MDWKEILIAIGGTTGIVALGKLAIDFFFAKSNKTKVDLGNMEQMLKDSMERYDKLEKRFEDFMKSSHEYVVALRGRIDVLEANDKKKELRLNALEKIVNVAWRCKFPENISDCPVIMEYEKRHLCEGCEHKEES